MPIINFWKPMHGRQAGDTIVEVLVAMTIISLVLAGAFSATTSSTHSTLDAQEHGQALKLIETQVEFLRAAVQANPAFSLGINSCFDNSGHTQPSGGILGSDPCVQQSNGTPAQINQEPQYKLLITAPVGGSPYGIAAQWDTPASNRPNDGNIVIYYRPN